jgi:hypothetical protein
MVTLRLVLVVGLTLILPQVVGFAAARLGRRLPASAWPLAAAATFGLLWAGFTFVDYRASERAYAAGEFRCGTGAMAVHIVAFFLFGAHFVVGSILGALDGRARRLFGADGDAGRDASPPAVQD